MWLLGRDQLRPSNRKSDENAHLLCDNLALLLVQVRQFRIVEHRLVGRRTSSSSSSRLAALLGGEAALLVHKRGGLGRSRVGRAERSCRRVGDECGEEGRLSGGAEVVDRRGGGGAGEESGRLGRDVLFVMLVLRNSWEGALISRSRRQAGKVPLRGSVREAVLALDRSLAPVRASSGVGVDRVAACCAGGARVVASNGEGDRIAPVRSFSCEGFLRVFGVGRVGEGSAG